MQRVRAPQLFTALLAVAYRFGFTVRAFPYWESLRDDQMGRVHFHEKVIMLRDDSPRKFDSIGNCATLAHELIHILQRRDSRFPFTSNGCRAMREVITEGAALVFLRMLGFKDTFPQMHDYIKHWLSHLTMKRIPLREIPWLTTFADRLLAELGEEHLCQL